MSITVDELTNEWWDRLREIRKEIKTGNRTEALMQEIGEISEKARLLRNSMDDLHDDASALFYEIEDTITGKEDGND